MQIYTPKFILFFFSSSFWSISYICSQNSFLPIHVPTMRRIFLIKSSNWLVSNDRFFFSEQLPSSPKLHKFVKYFWCSWKKKRRKEKRMKKDQKVKKNDKKPARSRQFVCERVSRLNLLDESENFSIWFWKSRSVVWGLFKPAVDIFLLF